MKKVRHFGSMTGHSRYFWVGPAECAGPPGSPLYWWAKPPPPDGHGFEFPLGWFFHHIFPPAFQASFVMYFVCIFVQF